MTLPTATAQYVATKPTLQSQRSTDSTSYFSQISCGLTETFSIEKDDEKNHPGDEVLSFLVSEAYSIEHLAAEADGKPFRRNALDGAGVVRIDVYCQSGTVCTCRLIQTAPVESDVSILDMACKVETPRKGNLTGTKSNFQMSTQF